MVFIGMINASVLLLSRNIEEVLAIKLDTVSCTFVDQYIEDVYNEGKVSDPEVQKIVKQLEQLNKIATCFSHPHYLNLLGLIQYKQNQIVNAREYLLQADSILKYRDAPLSRHNCLNHIFLGLTYNIQDDFPNAFHHFNRAKEIGEELGDEVVRADALSNLGLVKLETGNPLEAKNHFLSAKVLYDSIIHEENLGYVYLNLARVHIELDEYEKGIDYANHSERIWENRRDSTGLYYVAQTKANVYSVKNDWENAILQFEKAIKHGQSGGINHLNASIFVYLADIYIVNGDQKSAQLNYEKALEIGENLSAALRDKAVLALIKIYRRNNQFDKLAKLYPTLLEIDQNKVAIRTLENEKALKNAIALEKEKLKNKTLELGKSFDEEKLQLKNRYILFLGIATLLSCIIGLITFNQYRIKKGLLQKISSQKVRLEEINEELSVSTRIISEQNRKLEFQNQELQNFTYTVSHDLKAPARTIASFSGLLRKKIKGTIDEDSLRILDIIENGGKNMFQLVSDLLEFSKLESKQLSFETVQPEFIIREVLNDLASSIEDKEAQIELKKMPKEIMADSIKLKLVFQNLIANALKFIDSGKQPKIIIQYEAEKDYHIFSVKDNGIGIAPEYQEKIFDMFTKLHNSSEYEGSGIGLSTCMKIINLHEGNINVDSQEGIGSTFSFSIAKHLQVKPEEAY